jgi:asparagine synthase (glutamine-hydrolysing)
MHTLGDLLILFDPQLEPTLGRLGNADWQCWPGIPSFWMQPASSEWRGFPVQRNTTPDWEILALGEGRLQRKSNLPQDATALTHTIAGQHGSFLIFGWNFIQREWHAWTDRFGTLHAYYAFDGKHAALGTFSPGVAAVASRRCLDWEALAGWFSFGFFPAERTHFADVRILRPATHYTFAEDGHLLKQERYWQWHYEPDQKRSYEDTVQEFGSVFEKVMSDALQPGRVALPVSGGLDSRSTVARVDRELADSGRVWSYAYGYTADSVETHIACQVAERRRLPFQAYTILPYLFDQIKPLLAYTEGFQDITQARQMFVRDEIGIHADTLIAALWGDVWLDDMGMLPQPFASEEDVCHHTFKKIRKQDGWLLQNIALPQLGMTQAEPLLTQFVRSELQNLEQISDTDFRVKAYKTEQWSFRWSIPPTRIFQSAAWPRKVFYDTRLADFFMTVPGSFVSGRKLQVDYLKRFAPDLAAITWQAYDANLYQYRHFNSWQLPKRLVKRISRTLRPQTGFQRNWEVQFLNREGRAGLECWLTRPGLKLHEFVPASRINTLIDDLYQQQSPVQAYPVCMLLTFSTWLEMYG